MPRSPRTFLSVCWLLVLGAPAYSEDAKRSPKFEGAIVEPPSRDFDFRHLKLECEFDWEEESVDGTVTHTVAALERGARRVKLDSVGIDIRSVELESGGALSFETKKESLEVDIGRELEAGEEVTFRIHYRAEPRLGVYFKKPLPGSPDIPKQIWTQGETHEARHWIPCFDHPSDKLTTETLITVPRELTAISNGALIEKRAVDGDRELFHWRQKNPHTTYLITVVVGKFSEWKSEVDGIPLAGYVRERFADRAERSFGQTADMMRYFSEKFGYPYPWERYDQLCVFEFPYGGMENTTATTLTEYTLHDANAALDMSSVPLVAHELAHQWFGNLVTCRDWGDIWINESFASFSETLYAEHYQGADEAMWRRHGQAESYKREDRGRYRRRLATRRYAEPSDVFDRHAYPKGARVLDMLRHVLGDDKFFRGIRHYLHRNAFRSVESADFRIAMEEATGESLRWFFDQWVHMGGHPEYRVATEWDEGRGSLAVTVEQTQTVDDLTPLFDMPVVIEVTTPSGAKRHSVRVSQAKEEFTLPAPERPRMVRFDPGDSILKDLEFDKSREELTYQLEHDKDMRGRDRAARGLKEFVSHESVVESLLGRIEKESFWGVRQSIVRTLDELPKDKPIRERVTRALRDRFGRETKAAVRRAIVDLVAKTGGDGAPEFLREVVANEPSYTTTAAALRGLGRVLGAGARADAEAALERDSHAEQIRSAAFDLLTQDVEKLEDSDRDRRIEILAKWAEEGKSRPIRTRALRAIARLGRGRDAAYSILREALDDRNARVRRTAVSALGSLGDARAIPALEALKGSEAVALLRNFDEEIDRAIDRIREQQKPDSAIAKLEERVRELEKKIAELEAGSEASGAEEE